MDEETKKRFDSQDELLGKVFVSVEKTRKYFKWTMIITIVIIVLPALGLMLVIPKFLSTFSSMYSGF